MYVVLSSLARNHLKYVDRCVGAGFNERNILFLLHRCALFHYFSFSIRWVSLKESQFIYLRIPQIFNSFYPKYWKSGRQFDSWLVLIYLSRKPWTGHLISPESHSPDRLFLLSLHRCALFCELFILPGGWFCLLVAPSQASQSTNPTIQRTAE
jgi:hypothetical protein